MRGCLYKVNAVCRRNAVVTYFIGFESRLVYAHNVLGVKNWVCMVVCLKLMQFLYISNAVVTCFIACEFRLGFAHNVLGV